MEAEGCCWFSYTASDPEVGSADPDGTPADDPDARDCHL